MAMAESLTDRLHEVLTAMAWSERDLMRITGQSRSVVSQWLGRTSKPIKTIGKLEAALAIEAASGYSALWIAKGHGPKRVSQQPPADPPAQGLQARQPEPQPYLVPEAVLAQLGALLASVPEPMRGAFADVLAGWARDGGQEDRTPALLALLAAPSKQAARG